MPGWKLDCFRLSNSRKGGEKEHDVFPAKQHIPEERKGTTFVELVKPEGSTLGLTISGGIDKDDKPRISNLRAGGIAQRSDCLQVGDYIASVNGIRTVNLRHEEIINLLKNCGDRIVLEVIYQLPEPLSQQPYTVDCKKVYIHLEKDEHSFGFTLRGGTCSDRIKSRPITVTQVRAGSSADREGRLKPGDRLLAINDVSVATATLMDALTVLYQCEQEVSLYIEYDVSVMEAVQHASGPLLVEIDNTPGSSLGIQLSNSVKNDERVICIDSVTDASIADRCGAIHVGDQLVSINGTSLEYMSVAEASQLLKTCPHEQIQLEIIPHVETNEHTGLSAGAGAGEYAVLYPGYHGDKYLQPSLSSSLSPTLPRGTVARGTMPSRLKEYSAGRTGGNLRTNDTHMVPAGGLGSTNTLPRYGGTLSRTLLRNRRPSNSSLASAVTTCHQMAGQPERTSVVLFSNFKGFGFTVQTAPFCSDFPIISQVEPGGSADRSGVIQEGDRLISINGCNIEGKCVADIHHMLTVSGIKVILEIEFDVADCIVPSSGVFQVKLKKVGTDLGLSIKSSSVSKAGEHLYICSVRPGSAACRSGVVSAGDRLLAIDNIRLHQYSADDAVQILQSRDDVVKLKIKKEEVLDAAGDDGVESTVELLRHGGPLGITISGTEEPSDPIVVSALTEGGVAARTGSLYIGDQVLAINNQSLVGQPLSVAIKMLQTAGEKVTLKVVRPSTGYKPEKANQVNEHLRDKCTTPIPSVDSAVDSWDEYAPDGGQTVIHRDEATHQSSGLAGRGGSPNSTDRLNIRDLDLSRKLDSSRMSQGHNSSLASASRGLSLSQRSKSCDADTSKKSDCQNFAHKSSDHSARVLSNSASSDPCGPHVSPVSCRTLHHYQDQPSSRKPSVDHGYYLAKDVSPDGRLVNSVNVDDVMAAGVHSSLTYDDFGSSLQDIFNTISSFSDNTPSVLELQRVTLYKDSCEDFGFGVSEGLYEPGIFISAVRPDGPADRRGVRPYDRLVQVNDVKLDNLDCRQAVHLIGQCGHQVALVIARQSEGKEGNHSTELWDRDELCSVQSLKTV